MSDLSKQIEAILFWKSEPMTEAELARLLSVTEGEIRDALDMLTTALSDRGIVLMRQEKSVLLATHPSIGPLIETLRKEELEKDIGKAGLETLTTIVYQGPLTRAEIDYIRGVNSTFILRNLMVRGLIERIQNPNDQRSFVYKPTFELLSFLGVTKLEDLPNYVETRASLEAFLKGVTPEEDREQEVPQSAK